MLADGGIACVDEIDKMRPEDRSAMHEGLEQQQISVSKAGINATLKSRCSLLGAANPKYGRFDQLPSERRADRHEPDSSRRLAEEASTSQPGRTMPSVDEPGRRQEVPPGQNRLKRNRSGSSPR